MHAMLIDTNILVYAYDPSEGAKQKKAIEVLDLLQASGLGRLSVQVLAEFFVAVTRGVAPRLSLQDAATQMERLARSFIVLDLTALIAIEATRGVRERSMSYWDAQLWATARLNQIPIILSEDFDVGATLEGISMVNPFADDFRMQEWLAQSRADRRLPAYLVFSQKHVAPAQ